MTRSVNYSPKCCPRPFRLRKLPLVEGGADVAHQLAASATVESVRAGARCLSSKGQPTPASCLFWLVLVSIAPSNRIDTVPCAPAYVREMSTIDPSARRSATSERRSQQLSRVRSEPEFSLIANAHPFRLSYTSLLNWLPSSSEEAAKVPLRKTMRSVYRFVIRGLKSAKALKAALHRSIYVTSGFGFPQVLT